MAAASAGHNLQWEQGIAYIWRIQPRHFALFLFRLLAYWAVFRTLLLCIAFHPTASSIPQFKLTFKKIQFNYYRDSLIFAKGKSYRWSIWPDPLNIYSGPINWACESSAHHQPPQSAGPAQLGGWSHTCASPGPTEIRTISNLPLPLVTPCALSVTPSNSPLLLLKP